MKSMRLCLLPLIVLALQAQGGSVWAHGGDHGSPQRPQNLSELAVAWEFDILVIVSLLVAAVFYAIGLVRLWRRAGIGRGVRVWEASCFVAGWLTLVIALVSPLHTWGNVLFSAHMVQHELLMLVAAPLLVLSRPLVAGLIALPPRWARWVAHRARRPPWQAAWHFLSGALVAWLIHAAVLWLWHVPVLFDATIESDFVHALQHLSFVVSALLFWWAIVHSQPRASSLGIAVLYLFTTALHSGLLGALITLTRSAWYTAYFDTTAAWGLTPLEDQQLGGLIMWIPACSVYILAGLALFAGWLQQSANRTLRAEQASITVPSPTLPASAATRS